MNAKRLGAAVLVLVCVIGLVLFRFHRDRTGLGGQSSGFSFHATKTVSRTSLISTSFASGSDETRLAPGRLVIFEEGTQPFIGRVATLLREALSKSNVIQDVTLQKLSGLENPQPLLNPGDGKGPVLFARLGDRDLEVSGLLSLALKGTVEVSLGTAPWSSSHSYQTNTTPPVLEFGWNAKLDLDMQISGVALDREEIAARAVAKQLADAMTKQLEEMRKKHGLLPELPGNLYGSYRPASVELPPGLVSSPAAVYSGLLTHNETFWNFRHAGDVVPVFLQLRKGLEDAGWKVVADTSEGTQPYLRVTRGEGTLSVFPARCTLESEDEHEAQTARLYVIHYQERFSDAERGAAVQSLLVPGGSADLAWTFEPVMSAEQREQLLAFPASSPSQYVRAAQLYEQKKDSEAAIRMLSRAQALLSVAMEAGGIENQIREVMKKLTGKGQVPELTEDSLRDAGFLEIGPGAGPGGSVKRAGEAANYYCRNREGKLHMISLRVESLKGAPEPTLQFVSASGYGRSSSVQTGSRDAAGRWYCETRGGFDSLEASGRAESAEEPGRYRLTVEIVNEPTVAVQE